MLLLHIWATGRREVTPIEQNADRANSPLKSFGRSGKPGEFRGSSWPTNWSTVGQFIKRRTIIIRNDEKLIAQKPHAGSSTTARKTEKWDQPGQFERRNSFANGSRRASERGAGIATASHLSRRLQFRCNKHCLFLLLLLHGDAVFGEPPISGRGHI